MKIAKKIVFRRTLVLRKKVKCSSLSKLGVPTISDAFEPNASRETFSVQYMYCVSQKKMQQAS